MSNAEQERLDFIRRNHRPLKFRRRPVGSPTLDADIARLVNGKPIRVVYSSDQEPQTDHVVPLKFGTRKLL